MATPTSSRRPSKSDTDSYDPSKPTYILSLPAELKLPIYLASLDRLSVEALARSCKAFYVVFYHDEAKIWKAERQVWQAWRNQLRMFERFEQDIIRQEFDVDKKLREQEKTDPKGASGILLKERRLRRARTRELLGRGHGQEG